MPVVRLRRPPLPPPVDLPEPAPTADKLYFYSGSVDKPPGKGVNEVVKDASMYSELSSLPHWRRVLSNFHVCPFVFRGKTYRTIEHAFQAAKIALASPEEAETFTVESGNALGLGDGLAARNARKLVVLRKAQIEEWQRMSRKVMEDASRAKYKQCPEAAKVLLATNNAELWHVVTRGTPDHFTHLETIREEMRRNPSARASPSPARASPSTKVPDAYPPVNKYTQLTPKMPTPTPKMPTPPSDTTCLRTYKVQRDSIVNRVSTTSRNHTVVSNGVLDLEELLETAINDPDCKNTKQLLKEIHRDTIRKIIKSAIPPSPAPVRAPSPAPVRASPVPAPAQVRQRSRASSPKRRASPPRTTTYEEFRKARYETYRDDLIKKGLSKDEARKEATRRISAEWQAFKQT